MKILSLTIINPITIINILLFSFLGISNYTFSQSGWELQYTSVGVWPVQVFFTDAQNGYVTGQSNRGFLKTNDGGETWTEISYTMLGYARELYFSDVNNGILISSSGRIRKTASGGDSWGSAPYLDSTYIRSVFFLNYDVSWAVTQRGDVYRTTNSWDTNYVSKISTKELRDIYFVDSNTGWLVGEEGELYKSTNGGVHWNKINTGFDNNFGGVYFFNSQIGWIVGSDGLVLYSTDGGYNWVQQVSNTTDYIS